MTNEDVEELKYARDLLENPGFAARLTSVLGTPLEKGFELLPEKWALQVNRAVEISLNRGLTVALATLGRKPRARPLDRLHKAAVVGTGGIGGAFGLSALAVELPITTTIMLRSIADIARSEHETLLDEESKLACLEVFALGGRSIDDDGTETGYYAVRMALATTLTEAARHIAQKGLTRQGAPAVVRFVSAVASRFGIVVTEKAAAMAVPAIGAIGGSVINGIFMSHFQNMARGHFKIRKLERKYGKEEVHKTYKSLPVRI